MRNILILSLISLFLVIFTSCGDTSKQRSANMNNQPNASDARQSLFSGEAEVVLDEMTIRFNPCGNGKKSYARMGGFDSKDRTADMQEMLINHNRVWIKYRIIHPDNVRWRRTEFEIVEFGIIKPNLPTPCECEKDTIIVPEPKKPVKITKPKQKVRPEPEVVIVKDDAPPGGVIVKEKPAANNNTEVGKKTGTITPGLISPSDVEVVTTIKVKGKQVSETTTNLGDVVDASAPAPESGEVDASE